MLSNFNFLKNNYFPLQNEKWAGPNLKLSKIVKKCQKCPFFDQFCLKLDEIALFWSIRRNMLLFGRKHVISADFAYFVPIFAHFLPILGSAVVAGAGQDRARGREVLGLPCFAPVRR